MTNEQLQAMESRRSKFDVQALVDEVRRLEAENARLVLDNERMKTSQASQTSQKPKAKTEKDADA
jgi:hypothetical protein